MLFMFLDFALCFWNIFDSGQWKSCHCSPGYRPVQLPTLHLQGLPWCSMLSASSSFCVLLASQLRWKKVFMGLILFLLEEALAPSCCLNCTL